MKLIQRNFHLDKLKDVMGTPDIKVITGIRRSGKSKLLESFMDYIQETDRFANIIHINFNLSNYENLLEYHALNDCVEKTYVPSKNNYVLIDEIQMCTGFEKAVNSLHASEKYDIYITGSNAFLLSSDLATLFTGRTFEIEVFPFSFQEFMQYFELTDQYAAFNRYIQVANSIDDPETFQREVDLLLRIKDAYPKLILTRTRQEPYQYEGVKIVDVADWLIENWITNY